MATIYKPIIDIPDTVEFFCEKCGCTCAHEISDVGDYEYYRCTLCGYQVSYKVR